jgi:hypothetical protein
MYIRRPDAPEPVSEPVAPAEESTLISNPYAAQQTPAPVSALPPAPPPARSPVAPPPPPPPVPPAMPAPARPAPAPPAPPRPAPALPPLPPAPEPTVPDGARRTASATVSSHDPSGDLAFAIVGAGMGLVGIALMVAAPVLPALASAGAFLGTLGVGVALLVLVTGGRGARPAAWGASIGGAFVIALAAGGATILVKGDAPTTARDPESLVIRPMAEDSRLGAPATRDPASAGAAAPLSPSAVDTPKPKPAVAPEPREEPPARIEPVKADVPQKSVEKADDPPRTESKPKAEPKPKPEVAPKSEPAADAGTATPPLAAIDTMLKSNKGVRSCFYDARAREGDLPTGVSLKITMQPSGSVTKASIPSGDWAGTEFESCLVGAVRGIQFPPYDGKTATFTYKFR